MSQTSSYEVIARKYRPQTFADLIGQDVMVRTLRNAFKADRIAQAFILTGIRGTGKTTTARIIAKGLNCVGPDGTGRPTTEPCGVCDPCRAIAESRHVDVLEMDAASRTGVGDIREIIDSVQYRAASARYKIYIIDEVHMLSTSAFNALLKTLEEPPAHVKFIFATTEIRKVPVTVLSRCQRFDLRRIDPDSMIGMLRRIATAEGAEISDEALALITRAAEGSARDAQSLLDQAISHGTGQTTADHVRSMLGLADRGRVLDLFDLIMKGQAAAALKELSAQYADGADPLGVLRDLAEVTHWVSVLQITPDAIDDPTINPEERTRGQTMAQALPMRSLTRMWQMLLKALEEISQSPNAMMAAEMAIIRLTHVADLPSPDDLIKKLQSLPPQGTAAHTSQPITVSDGGGAQGITDQRIVQNTSPTGGALPASAPQTLEEASPYTSFLQVLNLIRDHRDMRLLIDTEKFLRLVSYVPGRITFEPAPGAPADLAQRLSTSLQSWTGRRWAISVVNSGGAPSVAEDRDTVEKALEQEVKAHPLTVAVLEAFPGAKIIEIRPHESSSDTAVTDILEEVPDDWDPFEEE